ncbi:MAG: hypothetical protein U0S12_03715 [Fimbriimonadales bacterium]
MNLAPNMGLFGKGMTGVMDRNVDDDWIAQGIPVTPLTDNSRRTLTNWRR